MSLYSVLALAFATGVIAGLRSLTAPALVCWAARWGWLTLGESPLKFMEAPAAAYIFTALAVGELLADKLPSTPDRRKLPSLLFRLITGGASGAALCVSAGESIYIGAALGALGAVAGAYGGYAVRHRLVTNLKAPDVAIALLEDAIAIGGGLLIVSRF